MVAFGELWGSSRSLVCRSPQKEGGCESFFLSYDSPAERSCSRQELPPLVVGSVERDPEDRGEDDEHVFPPHNTPAVGQEGGSGIKAQKAGRESGLLRERMAQRMLWR